MALMVPDRHAASRASLGVHPTGDDPVPEPSALADPRRILLIRGPACTPESRDARRMLTGGG